MSFCNSVLEWHAIPSEFLGRLVAATTESPWLNAGVVMVQLGALRRAKARLIYTGTVDSVTV